MFWFLAAFFVGGFLLASAFAPKPQNAPPPSLDDVQAPTAEEGIEIPVLFGTRDINGPNVVWWGNVKTVAIKKKGGKK